MLAMLCTLMTGCGMKNEQHAEYTVSVWYIDGEAAADALSDYIEQYNDTNEDGISVALRGFKDETALTAAFDSIRPDLLLCSSVYADDLAALGALRKEALPLPEGGQSDENAAPGYTPLALSVTGELDGSFFPIGLSVPVLAVRCSESGNAFDPNTLASFDAVCAAAGDSMRENCISAVSYADVIASVMIQSGAALTGERSEDILNDSYVQVYNILAATAYSGALKTESGDISETLSESIFSFIPLENVAALPDDWQAHTFPAAAGCAQASIGSLYGLALMTDADRDVTPALHFLSRLISDGGLEAIAHAACLVPAAENAQFGDSAAEKLLERLYNDGRICVLPYSSPFYSNRDEFETGFREALSKLK